MTLSTSATSDLSGGRWRTVVTIVLLVVTGKGLAFIREAFVASQLGASSLSDGYYLALAMPTVIYSLGALPFSMWVTARLAALKGSGASEEVATFYTRVFVLVVGLSIAVGLAVIATADTLVRLYAPGLDGERLAQAVTLTRIGAVAIPALGAQAVCNGRLFAQGRFLPVYVWLVVGSLVGLGVVVWLTPHYRATGAVWAFVAAAWASIMGPLVLARAPASSTREGASLIWVDDLGVSVVYRALVMQIYFQASLLLIYGFGSTLPVGELSAALFGSKIQTAVYETIVVTAGVLVFPRIAHLLQVLDHVAVRTTMLRALSWLLPATAGLVVLLITCRREIVALIYERNAFDDRAVDVVSSALLGYAPGIVGLTLVEIFHRTMVLRGRLGGYLIVFSGALTLNWQCCHFLSSRFGVAGLTLSSSLGVLFAGIGLIIYASHRLESMDIRQISLLLLRTTAAAGLTFIVLTTLHAGLIKHSSFWGQIITVLGSAVVAATILTLALLVFGHRWHVAAPSGSQTGLG